MIELYLSSDGKHTVHVTADTTAHMDTLAPYAKSLYADVLDQYGTKPQLWEAAKNGHTPGKNNSAVAPKLQSVGPVCSEHETPMRYRKGRYGDFWSCPAKRADGTWCTHTQPVATPTNGHAAPQAQV